MKIGIFGGTFNPIHFAHLIVAENAREEYNLDKVIFITSGDPPHKMAEVSARDRFNMTRLAIEGNEYFTDDDYEVNREEKSYSLYTLEYLKKKYPRDELYFIIGEDSLRDFPKWYKPEEILKLATLLVFPRHTEGTLKPLIEKTMAMLGGRILPVEAPVIDVSSTYIRERLGDTKTVRYMIHPKVSKYIKEHGLYAK